MQLRSNFHAKELVPPKMWELHESGALDVRWYLQPRMLDMLQGIRDRYNRPVQANTWPTGGDLTERGYRMPSTSTGATYSQHKLGAAVDFEVQGMTPDEVRADIMDNEATFYRKGLRAIESGDYAPTWVHADVRPTADRESILIVAPSS